MPRWTDAARAKHAELIRRWRPWAASTGPITPEGKARSARNADQGGDVGRALRLAQARVDLAIAAAKVEQLQRRQRLAQHECLGGGHGTALTLVRGACACVHVGQVHAHVLGVQVHVCTLCVG